MTKEERIYNGEKTVSSISGAGKNWTATCKRMKLEYSLIPHTKINSKWIKELNIRLDTVKLLEENIGRTLFDINCSNTILDPSLKGNKAKVNKWDLIKLKSFCAARKTIDKMKRQPTEWQKIVANNMTNKGLISNIYKQFIQLNIQNQTIQFKNGQKN